MGQILPFPKQKATEEQHCGDCRNAAMSTYGVYCMLFREEIFDEADAQECEAFERPYQYHG